jgi:phage terminase Nu1 subunit (DNA packaging protein)
MRSFSCDVVIRHAFVAAQHVAVAEYRDTKGISAFTKLTSADMNQDTMRNRLRKGCVVETKIAGLLSPAVLTS